GRRSSSHAPWESGSSGPSASSGRALRGVLSLLLRAALLYAVLYLAWLPVQPLFMRSLALGAERALRLVQRPPLVTSVSARDNVITIRSYVTGLGTPMAAWNG